MMHVSNLLDLSKIKKERQSYLESDLIAEETAEVINWLFSELRSNFTAFKQAWPDNESQRKAKKTWIKAFVLAGIRKIEQLQHGINHCYLLESPFVCSPGQFIAWCKPTAEELGFPSFEEAYRISIKINEQFSDYKHPDDRVQSVIKHAISQLGTASYRAMTEDKSRVAFKTNYDVAIKQFLDGELKIIPKSITDKPQPHPSDKQRSDEARLKCMEELRSKGLAISSGMQVNLV